MALFFSILLVVITVLANTAFSIFSPTLGDMIPAILKYQDVINITLTSATTLSVIYLADAIAIRIITHAFASRLRKNPLAQKLLPIMKLIVRLAIWAIGAFSVISGLGYDVTSLLAGTGFIGIAAALAGKEMLSNLLGSLSLVFGKFFAIGDIIRVKKDFEWEVVEISLSRTKLISSDGIVIYIPNKFLISDIIENKSDTTAKK